MKNPTPKQIRQVRGKLSVIQIAELMDVTRMTVYNWLNGSHPMKARDFEYLKLKKDQLK